MTLPLAVCRSCNRRPPFSTHDLFTPAGLSLSGALLIGCTFIIHPAGSLRVLAGICMAALFWRTMGTLPDTGQAGPKLGKLLCLIPAYRNLLLFAPSATVACRSDSALRDLVSGLEARWLAESIRFSQTVRILTGADELTEAYLPPAVMGALVRLVERHILTAGSSLSDNDATVIQADFALLPGRKTVYECQIATEGHRISRNELHDKLRRLLSGVPAWPVGYPIVFSIRRIFGDPSQTTLGSLLAPFAEWMTFLSSHEAQTYGQLALGAFNIELQSVPPTILETDVLCLRDVLPDDIVLKELHASFLEAEGRFSEALVMYDALIAEFPDEPRHVFQRIWCLQAAGETERAAAACQQRIAIYPREAAAHATMARLQLLMDRPADALRSIHQSPSGASTAELCVVRAMSLARLDRFPEAIATINKSLFMDGNNAEALLLRAKLSVYTEKWELALSDLAQLRALTGGTLESLQLEARALTASDRSKEAEDLYRSMLEHHPHHADLRLHFSQLLAQNGKLASARSECDHVLEQGSNAAAYGLRAQIVLEMGEPSAAIDDAERALELETPNPAAFLIKGRAKAAQSDLDGAFDDLSKCLAQTPEFTAARYFRGCIHVQRDEYESADADFSAVLAENPEWTDARVQRGFARLGMEQNREARTDFEAAIRSSPQCSDGYTGLAIVNLVEGKRTAAELNFNKALVLNPNDVRGRLYRATLLLQKGDDEFAKRDLDEVLAMKPDLEQALHQRALLHLYEGKFNEARNDFDRLLKIDPDNTHSLIGRSVAAEQSGDFETARADHDEAGNIGQDSAEGLEHSKAMLAAYVASRNSQFEQAIALATKVIDEFDDAEFAARRILGHSRWYSEQFVEALEDYSLILDQPEYATRHDYSAHGQILAELGEFEQALESLDRSVSLAREEDDLTGLAYSLNGRGRALTGLERFAEAEECFAESVRLKPDNAWLHFNRGLMYFAQQKMASAQACFELALCLDSPGLPPGKRIRAQGFVAAMQQHDRGQQSQSD